MLIAAATKVTYIVVYLIWLVLFYFIDILTNVYWVIEEWEIILCCWWISCLLNRTLKLLLSEKTEFGMASANANADNMISSLNIDVESVSPSSIVQCRICHDEDDGSKMETPCSCCGSLKVRFSLVNAN